MCPLESTTVWCVEDFLWSLSVMRVHDVHGKLDEDGVESGANRAWSNSECWVYTASKFWNYRQQYIVQPNPLDYAWWCKGTSVPQITYVWHIGAFWLTLASWLSNSLNGFLPSTHDTNSLFHVKKCAHHFCEKMTARSAAGAFIYVNHWFE